MFFLTALACFDLAPQESCPGEDPVALYGTQQWEGPAGSVLSLVTWTGPGRVCEVVCSEDWVHPGYIFEWEDCHEGRLDLELQDGEWGGLCAALEADARGLALCEVELPSGFVEFEIVATDEAS